MWNLKDTKRQKLSTDGRSAIVKNFDGTSNNKICSACELTDPDYTCFGSCQQSFHTKCTGVATSEKFVCMNCSSKLFFCVVCRNRDGVVRKCTIDSCGKCYHSECLKRYNISDKKQFICPQHFCHTCKTNENSVVVNCNMVSCFRCPVAFHSRKECVVAGCKILSKSFILCPDHFSQSMGGLNCIANIPWCSICSGGGKLLQCKSCSASYHENCLLGDAIIKENSCTDCGMKRYLTNGSIVWAKIGSFRWWPACIISPEDAPKRLQKSDVPGGEFLIQYFGTKEYFWTNRGKVHPYFIVQEELFPKISIASSSLEVKYKMSIEEANVAFSKWNETKFLNHKSKPQYRHIRSNRPIGNVMIANVLLPTRCACNPKSETPCGYNSDCINRSLHIECHPRVCAAGHQCQNQVFQKRQHPKLVPFKTENRGWALKTLEDISTGCFIIEYVGELIDEHEYNNRLIKKARNNDYNFYFLTVDKNCIIDAGTCGNYSRFLNHSCDPNCETQKWVVNGHTRVGIFAKKDISTGTELTFDYQMESMNHCKMRCLCGTKICRGVIGAKAQNALPKQQQEKMKEQRRKTLQLISHTRKCFICNKTNKLVRCTYKQCSKLYHIECLGRDEVPMEKWQCPWHHCDMCGRLAKFMCAECTNSFCDKHKTDDNMMLISGKLLCSKHAKK